MIKVATGIFMKESANYRGIGGSGMDRAADSFVPGPDNPLLEAASPIKTTPTAAPVVAQTPGQRSANAANPAFGRRAAQVRPQLLGAGRFAQAGGQAALGKVMKPTAAAAGGLLGTIGSAVKKWLPRF